MNKINDKFFGASNAFEYFQKEGRNKELDTLNEEEESQFSVECRYINQIISVERAIHISLGVTGVPDNVIEDLNYLRSEYISSYELMFKRKYVEYNNYH